MKPALTAGILVAALCVAIGHAQPARDAEVRMKAAQQKAEVEGDLSGAIEEYKRALALAGSDRALAAEALLRMAECYSKLGHAEAARIHERIVREYADQTGAVAIARARLAERNTPPARDAAMSTRRIWTLPGSGLISGKVSRDGRYLPYTNWSGPGRLFLHDISSGTNRQMTADVKNMREGYVEDGGTFSPDDEYFAYSWQIDQVAEVRIIAVRQGMESRPRVLYTNPDLVRVWPEDWSADGRWLAVQLRRKDKTAQIGLVSLADGSLRVLKSVDWRGATKAFFSPDGNYLAYDLPAADANARRDVFALAVDGSREIPAVVHPSDDVLVGWSPDGQHLLFSSDRTGAIGLWSVPFTERQSAPRAPQQLKPNINGASIGVTKQGVLYTNVNHSSFTAVVRSDIHSAPFDFAKSEFLSAPAPLVHAFVGANNFPTWSPDGKQVAFLSRRGDFAQGTYRLVVVIASTATQQFREIDPQLNIYSGGPGMRWSPDGRFLAIQGTDAKGRRGIFRIDASTGDTTPMAIGAEDERLAGPVWAPDGSRLYYSRFNLTERITGIVARDPAGNQTEVFRQAGNAALQPTLSPDGKHWALPAGDWFAGAPNMAGRVRQWSVELIGATGGAPQELMRAESHGGGVLMWAPDSRWVYVYSIKDKDKGEREVWRVPIDGSGAQRVALNVNALGALGNSDQQFHVHPDGKQVAFAASEPARRPEVWVLEHFLPARPGTRQR